MKKILKKNQVIVYVISLMLVTAGYLNYKSSTAKEVSSQTEMEIADTGDATLVSSNDVKVENNIETIDKVVETELDKNNMMYDFFYMFAKTRIPNMPVRTGYVYGYLKVKEYMRKNNLKIKDIVKLDWREVLNG